ncbi:hypothetical protein D3874_03010 [Oleomonas cavernae]|uniref:Uncharacterized protein n=1 Tax=Oleomonas cavernae TaxID=2320859 RepID=A0A418WU64_9PROT|nr:hypothetical protein [Oleomonas cavernae]RJF94800.1 hypothetical protein D3874_03010 [Oleomonas cavernae]
MSAKGDAAAKGAGNVMAQTSGIADAVEDGHHMRAVTQSYDGATDTFGEVVKNTDIGSETNIPRLQTVGKMISDMGKEVQKLVGGTLPGFKLTMRSQGVGGADGYGMRLIINAASGGERRLLVDDPNDYDGIIAQWLANLSGTMGGLDGDDRKAMKGIDWSDPQAGVKALAEAIERAAHPFVPPVAAMRDGGQVGNGTWNVDSVLAQYAGGGTIGLAGGEWVTRASSVTAQTRPWLDMVNRTGRLPANDNGLDGIIRTLRLDVGRDARRAIDAAGRQPVNTPIALVTPPPIADASATGSNGGASVAAADFNALRRDIQAMAEMLRQVVDVLVSGQNGQAEDNAELRREVHAMTRELATTNAQVTKLAARRGAA